MGSTVLGWENLKSDESPMHGDCRTDLDNGPEAEPPEVELPRSEIEEAAPTPLRDDGLIIDVMVVYTEGARTAVGGVPSMQALIDLAIAETNTSHDNRET